MILPSIDFSTMCRTHVVCLEKDFACSFHYPHKLLLSDEVLFKNTTTGITFNWEPREFYIHVSLYRLKNGQMPFFSSILDRDKDREDHFGLDDLITLRDPNYRVLQPFDPADSNDDRLVRTLISYNKALRACARDVLQGDFTVFGQLAPIVNKRVSDFEAWRTELEKDAQLKRNS